jgi:hypothetical protein
MCRLCNEVLFLPCLQAAVEMGLTSEQLLLLEEFVDGLKGGRNPEAGIVAQMQARVSGRAAEEAP